MGFLGNLLAFSILFMSIANFAASCIAVKNARKAYDYYNKKVKDIPEPKASDNFQRQKEIYQSTSHIIVPRTPTEIRNRNYEKIKNGAEYGEIKR